MTGTTGTGALVTRLAGTGGTARNLAPGETLFRAGARVRSVFVVDAGEIHLVRHPSLGRALTLQTAGPGALLAEASVFAPAYHCGAVAATASRVTGFAVAGLRRSLESDPGAAAALAAHLAREVQALRARAALLAIRSAEERVAAYLDTVRDPSSDVVDPGHPWTVVAAEIGLTHEAVYRALASLERAGRIARLRRGVRLLV